MYVDSVRLEMLRKIDALERRIYHIEMVLKGFGFEMAIDKPYISKEDIKQIEEWFKNKQLAKER